MVEGMPTHVYFVELCKKDFLVNEDNATCKFLEMRPVTPKDWIKSELMFDKELTKQIYSDSKTVKLSVASNYSKSEIRNYRRLEVHDIYHIFKFYGLIKSIKIL